MLAVLVLVLVAVLIIEHLAHHLRARTRPRLAAATVVPVARPGGRAVRSQRLTMPRDDSLRLLATGQQPAWLWPTTGRVQPIGGLPRERSGYKFIRVVGGRAIQAKSVALLRCGSCAGPPVCFLADRAQSVTPAGAADEVVPGAAACALWLPTYPPGADMCTRPGM